MNETHRPTPVRADRNTNISLHDYFSESSRIVELASQSSSEALPEGAISAETRELVGRFLQGRKALNVICLASNLSVLTAWAKRLQLRCCFFFARLGSDRAAILNVAGSGSFSSDRTIAHYAQESWRVSRCPVEEQRASAESGS
jgi:glucan phosphorylase